MLQLAQLRQRFGPGPRGNTIVSPLTSASILGPSAAGGKVKLKVRSKITGYESRVMSLNVGWITSASMRKVVVSDQFRTATLMLRPPREKLSDTICVKVHGPAMQVTLAFWNSFPSPASREVEAMAAFHFPSGEQGV